MAVEGNEPSVDALNDALQLAHYRRLLEAAGLASSRAWGGIIGRDGRVWWCDLDEQRWQRGTRSALEVYDRAFSLRLRVLDRQLQRNADPGVHPLVIPIPESRVWRMLVAPGLRRGASSR